MKNVEDEYGQGPEIGPDSNFARNSGRAPWTSGFGSAGISLIGRTIDVYRIEARIGGGAMAAVYRGVNVITEHRVALKVLLADADETVRERFRLEAQMVSALSHPNIVQTLAVSSNTLADGPTYIAMELVEGRSLADLLESVSTLNVADSCALLAPVARALAYAHSRNVVHRDVKPSNILLRRVAPGAAHAVRLTILDDPVVPLLSDFGIARALDTPDLTSAGRTIGTPAYMSPEQCSGTREIDGRADIYSLGAVLYRCLVGRSPFAGTTTQILYAHVYDPLTIPEDALRHLSPLIVEILRRSMAKNPDDRYASAEHMAADLSAGAGGTVRPAADLQSSSAAGTFPDSRDSTSASAIDAQQTITLAELAAAQPIVGVRVVVPAPALTPPPTTAPSVPVPLPAPPADPPSASRAPGAHADIAVGPRRPIAPTHARPTPSAQRASPMRGVTIGLLLAIPIFLLLSAGVGALLRIGPFRTDNIPAGAAEALAATAMPTAQPAVAVAAPGSTNSDAALVATPTDDAMPLQPANELAVAGSTSTLAATSATDSAPVETATPPEVSTPAPTPSGDINAYWQDAQELYAQGEWRQAADFLTLVQRIRADFESVRVSSMLGESNLRSALQSLRASDLAGAASALSKAAAAQPDNSAMTAFATAVAAAAAQPNDAAAIDSLRPLLAGQSAALLANNDPCAAADALDAALALDARSDAQRDTRADVDKATAVRSQCTVLRQALADQAILAGLPGSLLYSTQVDSGSYRVYSVAAAAGSIAAAVIDDGRQPARSPSSTFVAFRSTRPDVLGIAGYDLASGSDPSSRSILYTRGVGDAVDSPPSWNGSGDQLVFASVDPADQRSRVYTVAADGRDTPRLLGPGLSPAWNPTTGSIVYNGVGPDGQQPGLWLMAADGSGPLRLTDNGADIRPAWSPDGRTIVFMSSGRSDDWDVFQVDAADGTVMQLTTDSSQDGIPTISPDGQYVAFVSDRGGNWNIWLKPVAGGHTQLLAPIEGSLTNWLEHALQWIP